MDILNRTVKDGRVVRLIHKFFSSQRKAIELRKRIAMKMDGGEEQFFVAFLRLSSIVFDYIGNVVRCAIFAVTV